MARSRVTNGPVIRELRERAGVLQADMAKRIGVSASYLCRIESDVERPGLTSPAVRRLAGELGKGLDEITVSLADATAS